MTMSTVEEVEAAAQQFNGYVSFAHMQILFGCALYVFNWNCYCFVIYSYREMGTEDVLHRLTKCAYYLPLPFFTVKLNVDVMSGRNLRAGQ